MRTARGGSEVTFEGLPITMAEPQPRWVNDIGYGPAVPAAGGSTRSRARAVVSAHSPGAEAPLRHLARRAADAAQQQLRQDDPGRPGRCRARRGRVSTRPIWAIAGPTAGQTRLGACPRSANRRHCEHSSPEHPGSAARSTIASEIARFRCRRLDHELESSEGGPGPFPLVWVQARWVRGRAPDRSRADGQTAVLTYTSCGRSSALGHVPSRRSRSRRRSNIRSTLGGATCWPRSTCAGRRAEESRR